MSDSDELYEQFTRWWREPLCGKEWFESHKHDELPEQSIEIRYGDKTVVKVSASAKEGTLRRVLKEMKR